MYFENSIEKQLMGATKTKRQRRRRKCFLRCLSLCPKISHSLSCTPFVILLGVYKNYYFFIFQFSRNCPLISKKDIFDIVYGLETRRTTFQKMCKFFQNCTVHADQFTPLCEDFGNGGQAPFKRGLTPVTAVFRI